MFPTVLFGVIAVYRHGFVLRIVLFVSKERVNELLTHKM
jgi:hypothetical protein